MRTLYVFNMVTLDGFFEGSNKEIDWHNVDEEFNQFAKEQIDATDLLLFGRLTYELMAGYWPTETAKKDDPVIASLMNSIQKIVFSRTLKSADWTNTRVVNGDVGKEIVNLKRQPGKDIAVFGSANLASTLLEQGLIDEYRIMVNPVLLGSGRPLFKEKGRTGLKLLKTRQFKSGNVLLWYQPR